jgi:hypothetical protein
MREILGLDYTMRFRWRLLCLRREILGLDYSAFSVAFCFFVVVHASSTNQLSYSKDATKNALCNEPLKNVDSCEKKLD